MPENAAISVEGVSKRFTRSLRLSMVYGLKEIGLAAMGRYRSPEAPLRPSEFWALENVCLHIRAGERVGIIGPNGAGKSTLFSIIAGIYRPSLGQVTVKGTVQALITLGAGFHPSLSGRENIYVNAAILGMSKREVDRVLESIVEFAEIGEAIDAPVKSYSSGMLVRLGFSVAAHMNPDVLLLDEVLSVGDARFQRKCMEHSLRLVKNGCTVVMVSHNLSTIQSYCDRAIWLDQGRVMLDDQSGEVVRRYCIWACRSMEGENGSNGNGRGATVAGDGIRLWYRVVPQEHPDGVSDAAGGENDLPVVVRGTTLVLEITYELLEPIIGRLNFWFHVKDAVSQVRVFGTAGWVVDGLVEARAGTKGVVKVEFPEVPLMDGTYCWDLGVQDYIDGLSTSSLASVREPAASFVVTSPREAFFSPVIWGDSRLPLVHVPCRMRWDSA